MREMRSGLSVWHPAFLLATWFGSGLLRPAPGTWGSLAALPLAWLLQMWGGATALGAGVVLVSLLGWWASDVYTRAMHRHDPGEIVIDEVAGQWLVLLAAGNDIWFYLAGFLLFRFFDIVKPWPVNWADRKIPGGLGVMLDDLIAGLFGLALLSAARIWWYQGT